MSSAPVVNSRSSSTDTSSLSMVSRTLYGSSSIHFTVGGVARVRNRERLVSRSAFCTRRNMGIARGESGTTAECNSLKLGFTMSIQLYINITIALAPFLVVHCRRVTIVLSLAVELPSRSCHPSPSRRALHHPLFVIVPSIAAHCLCALGPSPPCSRHPSPSRSHHTVPCRRGAVAPLPSRSRREPSAVLTDDSGHLSRP
jgi:hypothetical protein